MPRNWSALAESTQTDEEFFQSAAYQLLCAQVLYEADPTQCKAYRLIAAHRREFEEAFELFGMTLTFVDHARYVAAVPRFQNRRAILTLQESQLVLVLRKLYHEQASRGALEDDARALVTIEELRSAFKAATTRELPTSIKELEALIDQMQRFGLARRVAAQSDIQQPFDIAILPGVQTLVNETTLMKLSNHYLVEAEKETLENGDASSGAGADDNGETPEKTAEPAVGATESAEESNT